MNLTHHFLIAMPGVMNTPFAGSVVYVCEHNQNGALGFIINKPADLHLQDLFDNMALPLERKELSSYMVFRGGPVDTERGFVLHDAMRAIAGSEDAHDHSAYVNTMPLTGGLDLTTSRDILEAVALGLGPQRLLVALGCSCWGEHQLEAEIASNAWLTVQADPSIIFESTVEDRYNHALALLGLQDAWMLSPIVGHA